MQDSSEKPASNSGILKYIILAIIGLMSIGAAVLCYFFEPNLFNYAKDVYYGIGGAGAVTTIGSSAKALLQKREEKKQLREMPSQVSVVVHAGNGTDSARSSIDKEALLTERLRQSEERTRTIEKRALEAERRAARYSKILKALTTEGERALTKLTSAFTNIYDEFLSIKQSYDEIITFLLAQEDISIITSKRLLQEATKQNLERQALLKKVEKIKRETQTDKVSALKLLYDDTVTKIIKHETMMTALESQKNIFFQDYRLARGFVELALKTKENYQEAMMFFLCCLIRNAQSKKEIPKTLMKEKCNDVKIRRSDIDPSRLNIETEIQKYAPIDATPARSLPGHRRYSIGDLGGAAHATPYTPVRSVVTRYGSFDPRPSSPLLPARLSFSSDSNPE